QLGRSLHKISRDHDCGEVNVCGGKHRMESILGNKSSFLRSIFMGALFASQHCLAGGVVVQNVSPGATTWPGTPAVSTFANPSSATVAESFNGGGGNTN